MNKYSKRRLAENEVIFRKANQSVSEFIKDSDKDDVVLKFYCECSREDCRMRIPLTAKDYESYHGSEKQFIILPGHETPEIEKIVSKEDGFYVIEKFALPPSAEEINAAVKSIKL